LSEAKKVKEGKQETTKYEEKKKVDAKKYKDEGGENKKKLKEKENKKQTKPEKQKKKEETIEKKKPSPKIVETVRETEEIIKSAKKKQGKNTVDDQRDAETVSIQSKKSVKATKIESVPEENVKSKKIAEARKRQQNLQDEKQTAAKKQRQKRKSTQEPHAFETCDIQTDSQSASHNECESGQFESLANDQVVMSVIETSEKVTSTVEHPHENDVI